MKETLEHLLKRALILEKTNREIAESMLDFMATDTFDRWYLDEFEDHTANGTGTKAEMLTKIKSFFTVGDTRAVRIYDYMKSALFDSWYHGKLDRLIEDEYPEEAYQSSIDDVMKMFMKD